MMEESPSIMDYKGYGKMSESTQSWSLTQQEHNQLFQKTQWVVTEKIHGANCCFILDRNSSDDESNENETVIKKVHVGKRRGLLSHNESFFNVQSLLPDMTRKLNEIHRLLLSMHAEEKNNSNNEISISNWSSLSQYRYLYVFGEVFGGYYPSANPNRRHDATSTTPSSSSSSSTRTSDESDAVQTGIWYSPNIEFCAFDIALQMNNGDQHFLDYQVIRSIFERVKLMYNEPLFIGKFEQCMDYNIHFITKIPSRLGLQQIEGNKAEGVVIRPVRELLIETKKGRVRPLVKRKIEEFSEVRFDMTRKQASDSSSAPSSSSSSSVNHHHGVDAAKLCEYEMLALITMNRLNNAISKLGKPDPNNKAQNLELLQLYVSDVIETLTDDEQTGELYRALSNREKEELQDKVTLEAKRLIFEYYKQQQKRSKV